MRPQECRCILEAGIRKTQIQFEALIIPYLPGTQSEREATVKNKLREDVIVKVKRTVEQITKLAQANNNDCSKQKTISVMIGLAIQHIRTLFRVEFVYFPFVLEFEKANQTDIARLTQRFNDEFDLTTHSLSKFLGEESLAHLLIPGVGSVKSAIQVVKEEKNKMLEEAGKWATTDHREYGQLLNRILKILMKQVMLIYVSHRRIRYFFFR